MTRCLCGAVIVGVALSAGACGGSGSTQREPAANFVEPGPTAKSQREEEEEAQRIREQEQARIKRQKARAKRRAAKRRAQRQAESGIAALTRQLHDQWSGIEQDNFQIAYEVCGSFPESQLASEFGTSSDPSSIAHAYGLEYREFTRAAVEEGCLRALIDTKDQWEAEVNAFG